VIRGIIFDCFGVLAHGSLDYLRSIVSPKHLQELNDFSIQSDKGLVSFDDYLQRVGEMLGKTPEEVNDILHTQRFRNEEMISLARSLHGHYKTALLSNIGRGVIQELFSEDELGELFDTVTLSSEVAMIKPDPEVYKYTATKLDLQPEECVMIDDILANVEGAKAAGMQAIVFGSRSQMQAELQAIISEKMS
jgi:putative hydrolase of the HAD superfamily